MAQTYYAQTETPAPTMTVAELIERLQTFDPTAPVIFRSPLHGCFGPNAAYTIDAVANESLERDEHHTPAGIWVDEETGERRAYEAETQVFHAWSGVVIR